MKNKTSADSTGRGIRVMGYRKPKTSLEDEAKPKRASQYAEQTAPKIIRMTYMILLFL